MSQITDHGKKATNHLAEYNPINDRLSSVLCHSLAERILKQGYESSNSTITDWNAIGEIQAIDRFTALGGTRNITSGEFVAHSEFKLYTIQHFL